MGWGTIRFGACTRSILQNHDNMQIRFEEILEENASFVPLRFYCLKQHYFYRNLDCDPTDDVEIYRDPAAIRF